jgi:CheY-like chemotaxis protein
MRTILLVDDDQLFNFISSEMIGAKDPDSQIITFLSSIEALDWLNTTIISGSPLPDILFLDVRMPELTGFELLDRLMTSHPIEVLKKMEVYMLTSSLDEQDSQKASINPLVKGFLSKPLDMDLI